MPIFSICWRASCSLFAIGVKADVLIKVFGDGSQCFGGDITKRPDGE